MAELADFDEEFVDRLRESTAGFIKSVGAAYDGQLPVKTIYVPEDEKIVEKDISWPLPLLDSYRKKTSEAFRETARWIEANPDRSYRWEGEIFNPSLQDKQPYLDDLVYDPNQEQLIKAFENDLFNLSREIVKYTGNWHGARKHSRKQLRSG